MEGVGGTDLGRSDGWNLKYCLAWGTSYTTDLKKNMIFFYSGNKLFSLNRCCSLVACGRCIKHPVFCFCFLKSSSLSESSALKCDVLTSVRDLHCRPLPYHIFNPS